MTEPVHETIRNCTRCGLPAEPDAVFCGNCGTSIVEAGTISMSRSEPREVSMAPSPRKSDLGAALMSFFVWGSGQFYVGQGRQKAAIFIALWIGFVISVYLFWNLQGGLLVLLAGAFFGIYAGYDAQRTVRKINKG